MSEAVAPFAPPLHVTDYRDVGASASAVSGIVT